MEIVTVMVLLILMPYGPSEEFTFYIVDGSPKEICKSDVACAFLKTNEIYIDMNEIDQRDHCGRNPVQHELAHFRYDFDVHKYCYDMEK